MAQNYVKMEVLGQGTFGVVQKVFSINDNQHYALKVVNYNQLKDNGKANAVNEINYLSEVQHPNVINYKDSYFDQDNNLCTVMELAKNGDLAHRILAKKQSCSHFSEKEVWAIGRHIINGLDALHAKNIIHRDIKPANILFGQGDVAKIADLNVSIKVGTQDNLSSQIGTPYYASPEVWGHEKYSFDCDVWSFGCVIYEMCTLKKPFEGSDINRLYKNIIRQKYEPISYRYSRSLAEIIQRCLLNKCRRISVKELKRIFEVQQKIETSYAKVDMIKSPLSMKNLYTNEEVFGPRSSLCRLDNDNPQCLSDLQTEASTGSRKFILDKYLKPERKLTSMKNLNYEPIQMNNDFYSQKYIRQIEEAENTLMIRRSYLQSPIKTPARLRLLLHSRKTEF